MKKFMFSLTVIAALFVAAASATAQQHTYETLVASNACTIAETAGTNINKVIDCRKQGSNIGLQIELMADANGAYTVTIPIHASVDGVVYSPVTTRNIAIAFNGVTKQTILTNVPVAGALFLKIPYLTNATASINVTNVVLKREIYIGGP